jgi:peptidoglycan pentaglycine glycine transferase (the first glycine)
VSAVDVRRASAADRAAWDAFVASRPEGDPLQLWAWGDAREPDGERPVRLVALGERGQVRGAASILVRATSLGRAIGYVPHGPVWEREAPDAGLLLASLIRGVGAAARIERVIVVKMDPRSVEADDAPRLRAELGGHGLRRAVHDLQAPTTRIVDLRDGGESLWRTWDPAARNQARRAVREGVRVTVHRGPDRDAIGAFHDLLRATADRAGFRIHPRGHFERLAQGLEAPGGWYLVVAHHDGRPVAADVMLRVGRRAYYLYGASRRDPEVRHLYASYGAMAEAMRVLAEDGVTTLDLWGVAERDDPEADPTWRGFSEFKRQFGGSRLRHPGTFDLVVDRRWDLLREARERARDTIVGLRAHRGRGAA